MDHFKRPKKQPYPELITSPGYLGRSPVMLHHCTRWPSRMCCMMAWWSCFQQPHIYEVLLPTVHTTQDTKEQRWKTISHHQIPLGIPFWGSKYDNSLQTDHVQSADRHCISLLGGPEKAGSSVWGAVYGLEQQIFHPNTSTSLYIDWNLQSETSQVSFIWTPQTKAVNLSV